MHTNKWIKYFHDKGHEIHCIWNEWIEYKIDWVKYYSYQDKIKDSLMWKFFIFRLIWFTIFWINNIKNINPDVTHLHFIGLWSLIALFYKSKKLITTIWWSDILVLPKKIPFYKKLVKSILHKSDLITMDWFNTYNEALSYWVHKDKLRMIGFWIDTKIFKNLNIKKDSSKPIKIISLRSLNTIYDINTIINAANILKNMWKDFIIDIYWDWSEKENLINMTNNLNLKKYINFKWRYNNTDLPLYINNSDIYVSVSLSDSWLAWSTGEAMACWVPAIITDNADNSKWVDNFKNWFIIPNKSPEKLAEKINYFIENRDKLISMWEKNTSIIKERNDYYNEMEKVNIIYKTI